MIWTIDPQLRLGFGIIRGESKPLRTPPRNKSFLHSLNTDLTTHNLSCSLASTFNITLTQKKKFRSFPTSSPSHSLQQCYNHNKLYNFCHNLLYSAHTNSHKSTIFSPSLITRHVTVCVILCSLNFSINSLVLSTALVVGLGWINGSYSFIFSDY